MNGTAAALITQDERSQYRKVLSQLDYLMKPLHTYRKTGKLPDPAIAAALTEMTKTTDPVQQLKAMESFYKEVDRQYDDELKYSAQFKFSPFCEYMYRHEVPAKHHEFLIDHMEMIHHGEIKRLAISMPPGAAKALALTTPIATPSGWTTMGELREGDQVFDENGNPCNVTWVSPVWKDRPVYAVTTDCGDKIIADKEHEWLVRSCGKREVYKIKETQDLHKARSKRVMIKRAKALELPTIPLPIDPYLLGIWLGDGTSSGMSVTCSEEDQLFLRPELERLGYNTSTRSHVQLFGVNGIRSEFVKLDLINDPHHNTVGRKHIPPIYMRASAQQRLMLLQGLIDSDGTVCKQRGSTTFCNTNWELAFQVRELVRSLGVKAGWAESDAVLNGHSHGPVYRVSFYLEGSARLPRKAVLTRNQQRTPDTYIDVEPAGFADTVCIEVDSPSHLFLCGRSMTPTHNSSYASVRFAAWHLGRRPSDRWVQGAHTMQFAKDRLGKPVRSLITENRYAQVFPEMRLSAASSAADYFEFAGQSGYYKAVGVGTGIAGYRFEIGAIDDPIASREDAESPTTRRKLHEWYDDDFGTRPSNPDAPIFIVNTRWHEDDLVGHELQKLAEGRGDQWTVINIPALAVEDDPLGRAPGEGLWPEVFGTAFYLSKKRTLTGRSWNSLYQGNPIDEEGGVLKRTDTEPRYKNIPKDEERYGKITKKVVKRVTLSVDCAEKATQRSDYTAATVWLETMDKKHYLIHAARCKKEFVDMVKWIEEIAREYDVDAILVEDRGAGTQYIQIRNKAPGPAPVVAISTKQQSKVFRFDGVTPMFAAGTARLPESGTDWLADVEAEIFAFPAGKNDDYVDTISQYLALARESSGDRRGVRKMRSSTHA